MSPDATHRVATQPPLKFGYTPDPDDAFHYYALEHGLVGLADGRPTEFVREHVQVLNEMALDAALEVTAISSVFYPHIDDRYVVLASGASVGRGYGPVLAVGADDSSESLAGRRIGVPGLLTTGCFLLRYFHRQCEPVPMPFDQVADAVIDGNVDGGVLIHEELLRHSRPGLVKRECLGNRWSERTGLPLPVGLVVGRRDLGENTLRQIQQALQKSMEFALEHRQEGLEFACRFGSGRHDQTQVDFVDKFANRDTACMPDDVRQGLRVLYREAFRSGLIDHEPAHEIV